MKLSGCTWVLISLALSNGALAAPPAPLPPSEVLQPESEAAAAPRFSKKPEAPAAPVAVATPAQVVSRPQVPVKAQSTPTPKPKPVVAKPMAVKPTPVKPMEAKPFEAAQAAPEQKRPEATGRRNGVIYIGDRVVTDTHYSGVVTHIYANQTADIHFDDGSDNNWPINRLSKPISSLNGFEVRERVVTETHYHGTITAIFADATANIHFDDGSDNIWPLNRIGKVIRRIGEFSVNQVVVTDTHYRGTITAIYSNSTADIHFEDGSDNNWSLNRLSAPITRLGGFHVRQAVVTDTHYRGTITAIYADSTATIHFEDGSDNNWPLSRIFGEMRCSDPKECRQD